MEEEKMKALILAIAILALMTSAVIAAPVKVTAPGEAYGHHGSCGSWNGCSNAATCAQMVCQINGFNSVVSYQADNCFNGYSSCRLFNSPESVDCNWGRNCDVPVVSE